MNAHQRRKARRASGRPENPRQTYARRFAHMARTQGGIVRTLKLPKGVRMIGWAPVPARMCSTWRDANPGPLGVWEGVADQGANLLRELQDIGHAWAQRYQQMPASPQRPEHWDAAAWIVQECEKYDRTLTPVRNREGEAYPLTPRQGALSAQNMAHLVREKAATLGVAEAELRALCRKYERSPEWGAWLKRNRSSGGDALQDVRGMVATICRDFEVTHPAPMTLRVVCPPEHAQAVQNLLDQRLPVGVRAVVVPKPAPIRRTCRVCGAVGPWADYPFQGPNCNGPGCIAF